MAWLIRLLEVLLAKLKPTAPQPAPPGPTPTAPPAPAPKEPPQVLYDTACSFLGRDASPEDIASDEYGCAETVSDIVHAAFGDFPPDGRTIVSTAVLYQKLKAHPKFKQTQVAKPGNIIISPTGMGNGTIPNGHTGIFGKSLDGLDFYIMSNTSKTGLFEKNYTLFGTQLASWVARFRKQGGYPLFYFERTEL